MKKTRIYKNIYFCIDENASYFHKRYHLSIHLHLNPPVLVQIGIKNSPEQALI